MTPENNKYSLDDIDNEGNLYTYPSLNYSSSYPRNSEISTISEITIATDTTTAIGHTALKEVEKAGGRYNRAVRGYFNIGLPNGNTCLKRTIWYCNGC